MPKPMLVQYGYLKPEDIAKLCHVSMAAARIRAEELGGGRESCGYNLHKKMKEKHVRK